MSRNHCRIASANSITTALEAIASRASDRGPARGLSVPVARHAIRVTQATCAWNATAQHIIDSTLAVHVCWCTRVQLLH
jgi:hypothetical protein